MDQLSEKFARFADLSRRESLGERIYADMRRRFQRGEIQSNFQVSDTILAAQYGTSRPPAREALLRLANEGYLTNTGQGFELTRITPKDIREIFEVRRAVEPLAIRNSVRDMTDCQRHSLTAVYKQAELAIAAKDTRKLLSAISETRSIWLSAVHNERLAKTVRTYLDYVQIARLSLLGEVHRIHEAALFLMIFYNAYMERDAERAVKAMLMAMDEEEKTYIALYEANAAKDSTVEASKTA